MGDNIFGDVRSGIEVLKENMPRLDRNVKRCDPDSIRLFRSLAESNCRARANGDIDLHTFNDNRTIIYSSSEKFIKNCICQKRK